MGLSSSVSLSLAITFGFMTLYAIQTLSSFVGAESSVLLSTLPISSDDFSLITLFSFVRSVDYLVVGSVLSQVILVAYLTAVSFGYCAYVCCFFDEFSFCCRCCIVAFKSFS